MIKLIKNLKQSQDVEMVKGCATDSCRIDGSGCFGNTDICGTDSGSCPYVDICNTYDASTCVYVDTCYGSVDNYNCGVQYDSM